MPFIAIPAQKSINGQLGRSFFSGLMSRLMSEPKLELEKISDLANLYIEMQTQQSKQSSNKNLENIRKKINAFIAKLQGVDPEIFSALFGNIRLVEKPLESEELVPKLKEFFDEIFQRIYQEITLEGEDLESQTIPEDQLVNGFCQFKLDALRPSNKIEGYNTIKGIDGKALKEFKGKALDYVIEEDKKTKTQKEEILESLDGDLKTYLQRNLVKDDDIEKFKSLIYLLFSQYSMQQFVVVPLFEYLSKLQFIPGKLSFKKEDFSIKITIMDNKNLKIDIQLKKDKESKIEKRYDFRPDDERDAHGIKFQDIKSSLIFMLDEGAWKIKDSKISFKISGIC
ncbi:MAG: hypothetical protein K1060chlam1_01123 [Candidatus Anoxychlamydiales bacterium]|nr:hypothetical protein [Candidatus Anoxychlamydiales bacterium]